jgi:hypothetical protein
MNGIPGVPQKHAQLHPRQEISGIQMAAAEFTLAQTTWELL